MAKVRASAGCRVFGVIMGGGWVSVTGCLNRWRRDRDSNPGCGFKAAQPLSRRPLSTIQPSLPDAEILSYESAECKENARGSERNPIGSRDPLLDVWVRYISIVGNSVSCVSFELEDRDSLRSVAHSVYDI